MDIALFSRLACGRVVAASKTAVVVDTVNGCSLVVDLLGQGVAQLKFRVRETEVSRRRVACDSGSHGDGMLCAAELARAARSMVVGWVRLHLRPLPELVCHIATVAALRACHVVARFCGLRVCAYHDRRRTCSLSGDVTLTFAESCARVHVSSTRPIHVYTAGGSWVSHASGIRLHGSHDVHGVVVELCHVTLARMA